MKILVDCVERDRDRDRQRQRQTERQTETQRERQRQRETDRQKTERQRQRETETERDRQTEDRETETQRERETETERDRETDRDRQTDRDRENQGFKRYLTSAADVNEYKHEIKATSGFLSRHAFGNSSSCCKHVVSMKWISMVHAQEKLNGSHFHGSLECYVYTQSLIN